MNSFHDIWTQSIIDCYILSLKTCIIQKYVNDKFEINPDATISSTYSNKVIKYEEFNKSLSLDIWDTAGQELYRALTKTFFIGASIGILVYDTTNKNSFESIKNEWYESIKESGEENIILGVAGNKCDKLEEEQVPSEDGKKFAQNIGAVFQLTSCKESIGIDDLFYELGKKYLEVNNLIGSSHKDKKEKIKIEKEKNDKGNDNKNKKIFNIIISCIKFIN